MDYDEIHKNIEDENKAEDHEKHHCPFKAWCQHCVRGRANNAQHRKKEKDNEDDDEDDKFKKIEFPWSIPFSARRTRRLRKTR